MTATARTLSPPPYKNRIFNHTSEDMYEIPNNEIALVITSPPYNVGKEYDQPLTLKEHLELIKRVMQEVYRVLIPGGRIAINVANLGRHPYVNLNAHVARIAEDLSFIMRGEIIWVKAQAAGGSCAWGSWRSAANPTLRDLHEYVLVFSKSALQRPDKGESTIDKDEFLAASSSVWNIRPESAKRIGHPAPFPIELASRLINFFSFEGDIVLDPFMGSGTTAVAAVRNRRQYVGYETVKKYIEIAERRLTDEQ